MFALAVLGLLLMAVAITQMCVFRPDTNYPGSCFNRGENAAWLGVEWANEAHSAQEITVLGSDLSRYQIRYVFVYSYSKSHIQNIMVSWPAKIRPAAMLGCPTVELPLQRPQPIQFRVLGAFDHSYAETVVGRAPQLKGSGVAVVPVGNRRDRLAGVEPTNPFWTQTDLQRPHRRHSAAQSCSRFCSLSRGAGWSSAGQRTFPSHYWWVANPARRNTETGPTIGCGTSR